MLTAPRLETERLVLSPFQQRHLTAAYVSWLNDPEVVRYSEQRHRGHSLESCRTFIDGFRDGPDHLWAIEEKTARNRHIGNITTAVDEPNGVADIQILIGDRHSWGTGLGAEAWRAVMDYLFAEGFRKITAGTMAENTGMLRIMEKCGMAEEGRKAGQFILDGRPVDLVMSAKFRNG